jgi:valyl-tRNA synthetase
MGDVPFHTVYIHALVRDAHGQKMSKSRGNIIDPLELIDRYGCDALRLTLAALAAPGRDIKLSESRIEGYRNFATKLWNAARYAQMSECALVFGFVPADCRLTENRWIVTAVLDCAAAVTAALDSYRFDEAASRLYHFVWGTFCDWYLEFTKEILQGADLAARAETQATTAWILGRIVHLLHPIMPFITEEVWEQLAGSTGGMLITAPWPEFAPDWRDPFAVAEMEASIQDLSAIRGARAELNVPPGARVETELKDAEPDVRARVERHREHFSRLARVTLPGVAAKSAAASFQGSGSLIAEAKRKSGVQVIGAGATFVLRLDDVIDLEREKERLGKEIRKLDAELAKIVAKLANPNFLAKAKPEVVEEQRERQADVTRDRDRLKAAYDRLTAAE